MDFPTEFKPPIKRRRRRHSTQFKAQVLAEVSEPGASIAAVAQRHNLNANLIQKWRRVTQCTETSEPTLPGFIALPATPSIQRTSLPQARLELPRSTGTLQLYWPCDQARSLAELLKTLS